MIERELSKVIEVAAGRKKVIVLIGARQVGKTTLLSDLVKKSGKYLELNCDEADARALIEDRSATELRSLLEGYDAVLIDECQRVRDIGLVLKKTGDLKLGTEIYATGSSSLELAEDVSDSAAGRIYEYRLYALSSGEMFKATSLIEEKRMVEQRMVYGFYPDVVKDPSFARTTLRNLKELYLYKDILMYKGIKRPALVEKLVTLLAFQIGREVNYNELANTLGADKETVESYIDILEKCCILFKVNSFSRNMRNEMKKGKKIYFYDNGIRNAVINNFSPLEARDDGGQLWENMMVVERMKRNANMDIDAKLYFWRTHDGSEIDLIEECDGKLSAFEFKMRKPATLPRSFAAAYPGVPFSVVTPENYETFVC